jgi:hypothetical protein
VDQDDGLDWSTSVKQSARKAEKLQQEDEQGTIMNHAFTDRYVRSLQGSAMQTLLAGDGIHHLEPEFHQTEKMDNCAKVAAGQVTQIDIGHKGKPPYLLQAEWPGITPQFNTMKILSSLGRVMYNRQLRKTEITKEGIIARGCEPEEKQPDPNRRSKNMEAALQYVEHEGGEAERELVARKQMGLKKMVEPRPDNIHVVNYGDGIQPRTSRNYKSPSHPERLTHHWTYDGGISKVNVEKEEKKVEKVNVITGNDRDYKMPGEFHPQSGGYSDWTYWKNGKLDLQRFEKEVHIPMKRSLSSPPSQVNEDPVTHFLHGEATDGTKPKINMRASPSLACSPGGMDATLKHLSLEEVAIAREGLLAEDTKLSNKCDQLAKAHSAMREVVSSNKKRVNHLISSNMKDTLAWNAEPN